MSQKGEGGGAWRDKWVRPLPAKHEGWGQTPKAYTVSGERSPLARLARSGGPVFKYKTTLEYLRWKGMRQIPDIKLWPARAQGHTWNQHMRLHQRPHTY